MTKRISDLTEIFNTFSENTLLIHDKTRTDGDRLCRIKAENLNSIINDIRNGIPLPDTSIGWEAREPEPINDLRLSLGANITIEWDPPVSNGSKIMFHTIQRRVSGETAWQTLSDTILGNLNTFFDNTISPGIVYEYRHRSMNFYGFSEFSNILQVSPSIEETLIFNVENLTTSAGLIKSLQTDLNSSTSMNATTNYSANRPYYDAKYGLTGNNPAIVFPSDPHNKHFELEETTQVRDIIVIGCYKTGAESSFPADQALLAGPSNEIVIGGLLGQNILPTNITATIRRWGSDNAANTLLPMPFGMYRITLSQSVNIKYIGSRGLIDSGWLGAVNEIQMYPNLLTQQEYDTIIDNAVTKYNVFIPKRLQTIASIPEIQFWMDPDTFDTRLTQHSSGRLTRYNSAIDNINYLGHNLNQNETPLASRLVNGVLTPWITTNGKRALYFDQENGQRWTQFRYPLSGPGYTFAAVIQTSLGWSGNGALCSGNFFSLYVGTLGNRIRAGTTLSSRLEMDTPSGVAAIEYDKLQLIVVRIDPITGFHYIWTNGNLILERFDNDVSISNRVTHIGRANVLGGVNRYRGYLLDWLLIGRAVENDEITFIHDYFLNKYDIGVESVIA